MTRKRDDKVEALLRKADATLDEWLRRAKRQGAGALRQPVRGLQAGLEKLSEGLRQMEREQPKANTTPARRRARKSATTARRSKKAA